jgi:hypothetical protein
MRNVQRTDWNIGFRYADNLSKPCFFQFTTNPPTQEIRRQPDDNIDKRELSPHVINT